MAGRKRKSRRGAARADTPANLSAFQRTLHAAVIRPLAKGERTQSTWIDGRATEEFAEEFIKGNERLSAFERLQIYNRMYWLRLLECFYDDCPGLRALLGARAFGRLAEAYLTKHPSSSFTLRNLCSRLPEFLAKQPRWTAPHTRLAVDVARFEWAQTVAFDGEERPRLAGADIAGISPEKLKLRVQPYVTLLALRYPVDDYVIAVKRRDALRAEASHATTGGPRSAREKQVRRPGPERVWLAVHRLDNRLFYKRLETPAFKVLAALRDGAPLARAIAAGGRGVKAEDVREWFATWMQLGWFCR